MYEMFHNLISNSLLLEIGTYIGVVVSILFVIMLVRKRNRDERGWKIFGKASIISFVWLLIIVNVVAKITGNVNYPREQIGFMQFANTVQWIYNTTIMVELLSVFIIRKFE